MNRLLLSLVLISFSIQAGPGERATNVTLPGTVTLVIRLKEEGLNKLVRETDIVNDFVNKTMGVVGIRLRVDEICESAEMEDKKATLIACLLKDHPEALKAVQNLDINQVAQAIQDQG